jgi:sugar lactone lactonase YvrE
VWVAAFKEDAFVRLGRDGKELARIETPGRRAVACVLGGDDGRTLLLCGAPDFLEVNRRDEREAVLLTTTVEVGAA